MKHPQMMMVCILAAALIGYMVYPRMMESFKGNKGNKGNKGKWLFNASPHAYPVVCLAGDKHIPCTAFSSA